MKFTVTLSNPLPVAAYTGTAVAAGWAIGAHWGLTTTAAWMLFIAAAFLYLHVGAFVVMAAIAVSRTSSSKRT